MIRAMKIDGDREDAARRIVLFGASGCVEGEEAFDAAENLGRLAAARGWTVVTGGYGGAMLAASRGAARQGGRAIGVTCALFKSQPNPYLTDVIETENLIERLGKLIELGDAYVAMPGSTGTLAELALVWELVNKRLIPKRPIVCWGEFWRPVVGVFAQQSARDPHVVQPGVDKRGQWITFVDDYEAAMRALEG
jgi:hypothetical protein